MPSPAPTFPPELSDSMVLAKVQLVDLAMGLIPYAVAICIAIYVVKVTKRLLYEFELV